jgi:hypothetical protein
MNTSKLSIQQQPQCQETEAQEDQQQDSDEEIKAIIEDELTHCCHMKQTGTKAPAQNCRN